MQKNKAFLNVLKAVKAGSLKVFTATKRCAGAFFKHSATALAFLCNNVIRPMLKCTFRFFKASPRAFAVLIAAFLLVSGTATAALATGATGAYSVIYNGSVIATVKDPSVLADAEILAAKKLNNPICNTHLIEATLNQTIASSDSLTDSASLSDIMIERSENIVTATVLKVEDEVTAIGDTVDGINALLNTYLENYKAENGLDQAEFCEDMQAHNIYTLKTVAEKLPDVKTYLADNTLSVQAITTVVETREIAFETVKTESSKYTVGTEIVTCAGKTGLEEVTYKVATLDGVQTEKTEVSAKTVTEPTAKQITVGTKRVIAADKNGDAPMIWPVKRVEGSYVSSYVGDGRGHKGMDIVAKNGTPIYAAEGGTVTYSGWDTSGYGNKIIIKHANGLETLYAHCNALYVKVGDTVAAGESIASVGSTGRSTGNHLHFEVHKNGVFVNPSDYIGSN